MQETRVLVETKGTTGEETTSYWFDLPIDVAEFEEKLGVGAESGDYRIIEKVLPFADEVHEHTSVYQLNELDFMYRHLTFLQTRQHLSASRTSMILFLRQLFLSFPPAPLFPALFLTSFLLFHHIF